MSDLAAERIERAGPIVRAVTVWLAVFIVPIGAWAVHLIALSSIARLTCDDGWDWLPHVLSGVTLAATVAAMLLSWRLYRIGVTADESDRGPAGRLKFVGLVGLAIGAFNFALIALEEVLLNVFTGHVGCGL